MLNLKEACQTLSISPATGRNWLRSGRLVPDSSADGTCLFSETTIQNLKEQLLSPNSTRLKKRRNKQYTSGFQLYHSYLDSASPNSKAIEHLFLSLPEEPLSDQDIRTILAECALQLYAQAYAPLEIPKPPLLPRFLSGRLPSSAYDCLITDCLQDADAAARLVQLHPEYFQTTYRYLEREDLLGCLYISLQKLGRRKTSGTYYTPIHLAQKAAGLLSAPGASHRLLDPSCGTGMFLLQLPSGFLPEHIFGNDTDALSVQLARINLSLAHKNTDCSLLYRHITCSDTLSPAMSGTFDTIIGNPPWGSHFTPEEKAQLKQLYPHCGNSPEASDLFLEKCLSLLKDNGTLTFLLPEALLNVRSHLSVRRFFLEKCRITYAAYLGNAFDGVQCPAVLLQLKKTHTPVDIFVQHYDRSFTIDAERPLSPGYLQLDVTNYEYSILQKMERLSNVTTLASQADFALGIVTGDNDLLLSEQPREGWEPILTGRDIQKYRITPPSHYVDFQPQRLQQTAPLQLYHASPKLLYRFICRQLVFALDEGGRLSLNSCNVLIPRIDGLDIYYILAMLNSRPVQFYAQKKWNSIKVLRSHLEEIPIPLPPAKEQKACIQLSSELMFCLDNAYKKHLYDHLDTIAAALYQLSDTEYSYMIKHTPPPLL